MKRAFIALTMLVVLTTATILQAAALSATQTQQTNLNTARVVGTIVNGGAFTGTFDVIRFAVQNGQLVAVGTLSGTLRDASNNIIGTVTDLLVTLPITSATTATCEILNLQIGAISLELLGLNVDLAPISLIITAESGPGKLLGNLLCAIANLLNDGNPLTDIAGLLNRILRILG